MKKNIYIIITVTIITTIILSSIVYGIGYTTGHLRGFEIGYHQSFSTKNYAHQIEIFRLEDEIKELNKKLTTTAVTE